MADNGSMQEQISPALDALVGELLDSLLDALAVGDDPGVIVGVQDATGATAQVAFSDDSAEQCLAAAERYVATHAAGVRDEGVGALERYGIASVGCVDLDGGYEDAILVSFYERGLSSGYSAYVLVKGIGTGDGFMWSDPEPAGAEPALI